MTIGPTDRRGAQILLRLVAGYPAATLDLASIPEPWDELCRAALTGHDRVGRMAALKAALADRPDADTILRALHAQHPDAPPDDSAVLVPLVDVASSAVRWLWPGRLPLGKLTVLDGDPGLGKSVLTLDLAARVSAGRPMPDGTPAELGGPRGVVLLSAEDGLEDTIRPRLVAASADLARVTAFTSVVTHSKRRTTRLPTLSDLRPLREAIAAVDAALVVVDPIMAFLPSGVDGSNDAQVRSVLAPLAVLANAAGAAVLVVRHLTKSGGRNPLYRGGGSIGIIGGARSGLLAARDPHDPAGARRILASTKANLAAPPPSLAYRIETAPNGSIRVAWEGPTDHTAASLLDGLSARDERGALAEADDVLRQLLADGPKPVAIVQDEARQAGVNGGPCGAPAKPSASSRTRAASAAVGSGRCPPTPPILHGPTPSPDRPGHRRPLPLPPRPSPAHHRPAPPQPGAQPDHEDAPLQTMVIFGAFAGILVIFGSPPRTLVIFGRPPRPLSPEVPPGLRGRATPPPRPRRPMESGHTAGYTPGVQGGGSC